MSTAYEAIQISCRSMAGVSAGTYNENMIQAAKAATGITRDLTADEGELLLLQALTGDLTDTLPGMRQYWLTQPLPSALLDFTAGGTSAGFAAFVANTNSTGGYVRNSAGLLTLVPASTLRLSDLGLLIEESRTNVALWNRDLTNAVWTKTSATAAKDQIGADGVANAASSLTATGANATCLQAITLASSARFQSAYVKRITGTGTIQMTLDNGATWTTITVTSAYQQLTVPTQTLANPTVGFRIVTNGDAIAVDLVQNENGTFATSPIATTIVPVTRSPDVVTGTLGSWFNAAAGTFVITFSTTIPNSANTSPGGFDDGTSNNQILSYTSGTGLAYFERAGAAIRYNTGSGVVLVNGATNKVAMSYGVSPDFGAVNGGNTQSLASAGLPAGLNRLTFGGSASAGDTKLNGFVKKFKYFTPRLTDAQTTAQAA